MLWRVHPVTPQKQIVDRLVNGLLSGNIYLLPTNTVYAFVCSSEAPQAIKELYRLRNIPESHFLSLLCRDVAMAGRYAHTIASPVFRFMKANTPGPYTFILRANRQVDRRGTGKRKTVGVRIIDHPLHLTLMEQLDIPLVAASVTVEDEYSTDPEDLERLYGKRLAAVVDGGICYHEYSTILDCTEGDFRLVRRGKGPIDDSILTEVD